MNSQNLISKIKKITNNNDGTIRFIIAKYLIENLEMVNSINITQLSKECNCSKSSIVKFCKELNLTGLKELIRVITWEYEIYKTFEINKQEVLKNDYSYFELIINNLEFLKSKINTFKDVANKIKNTKGKIFLFGKGPNIHIAEIFNNYLLKIGYSSMSSTDFDVQVWLAKTVKENDLCFIFTYSGLTQEISDIFDIIKANKAITIVLTANSNSQIYNQSDYKFLIRNNEEIFKSQRSSLITFNFIIMQILNLLNLN
ncbi:MurR/RpiR family transcriptional regulator [Spiroplasma gladiatoris]|uniref:MurR/RpiR family transcriptional regulator n=1 Tax=Spiroplasma gladiatoris TaxID=2143 RepID=A0A4P7AID1_9MOLU|nr:MurR/RpiR family transcriptional regulator [Spiroplasma gladiatoris]QBQ07463.1 MurR/RpiR family transcriptional regulator [Spiroplasma gladiatoris]